MLKLDRSILGSCASVALILRSFIYPRVWVGDKCSSEKEILAVIVMARAIIISKSNSL